MESFRVEFLHGSASDLQEIASYITLELMNPESASRIVERINNSGKSLAIMPQRYRLVDDVRLARKGIRMMPVENYFLFYTIDKRRKRVSILRVLYNRRNWKRLL